MNFLKMFSNAFISTVKNIDATEEHKISLPGLDIAFNHTLKICFVVDQTGGNPQALEQLEKYLLEKGYFLHCVVVQNVVAQNDGINARL